MRKIIFALFIFLLIFNIILSQDSISIAKNFVSLLSKEKYEKAIENFDDTMKTFVSPSKLQEIWESVIKQVGEFKRIIDVRTEKADLYEVIYVTCEFLKMDVDVKVVLNKEGKISGLFFTPAPPRKGYIPPSYVDLSSFYEKDISIGKGEWILPGKLTIPKGDGPFPIVILVHGSGPNDMDESIGPNKPFRDLAWGLANKGIAVLRYDKRTKVYPDKFAQYKDGFTVMEEVIEDVLEAISFFEKEEKIDKNRIFILGHSLGGMLAPRIASLSNKVKGIIIMAGPTRSLEDLIWEQVNYIYFLDGEISEEEKVQLDTLKIEIEKIKNLDNNYSLGDLILGIPVKYWKDLKNYNPVETLKNLNIPILILQGERDYQVTTLDLKGWKEGLSSQNNVEFKLYPKLNHLFLEGEGKSTPEEYFKEGHIPEYVIKDIAEWILKK